MKKASRRQLDRNVFRGLVAALLFGTGATVHGAVEPSEWANRQALAVAAPGVTKLALPPATLDAARAGLEDLRLLDPAGRETPFVIERAAPTNPAVSAPTRSFRATLAGISTELVVETGTTTPLAGLVLATPALNFLKGARVEISADSLRWETLESGVPLFRQFGAEQLRVELGGRTAGWIRITIDDTRTAPVPFTGGRLALAATAQPAAVVPLPGVRIASHDEFADETVLSLDLGARHVSLASLEFETTDTLFARQVSFAIRELRDGNAVEQKIAADTIYRIAADGLPAREQLRVPLAYTPASRELLVHLVNGDSPPLAITAVRAQVRPTWIVFRAAEAGAFTLLTGNPDVAAPRYDLSLLASALRSTVPGDLTPGIIESNPGYRRRDGLADTPLLGGPIDPAPWRYRKSVQIAASGVQQLELDLDVLAHAQAGLADLRLVRGDVQVPYLLERPALSRATALVPVPKRDPQRPRLGRWELALPRAGLPLTQITLTASTALFQRHLRLFEIITDERSGKTERTLAEADWSRAPGNDRPLVLRLNGSPATDLLLLETDNGDNPALELAAARATYPVARLLFKADAAPLALYYGNGQADTPRYDLSLVAPQILTADKKIATLAAEEGSAAGKWGAAWLGVTRSGILFWAVLAIVVVALLVLVAKLLPKPPPSSA